MLMDSPMYAYIPVASLDRARKFYEQKLGFTPAREVAGGVASRATSWRSSRATSRLALHGRQHSGELPLHHLRLGAKALDDVAGFSRVDVLEL